MLEEIFAIRIAAHAVMGNHYHVVLYLDIERGRSWDRDEVIRRRARLSLRNGAKSRSEILEPKVLEFLDLVGWMSFEDL